MHNVKDMVYHVDYPNLFGMVVSRSIARNRYHVVWNNRSNSMHIWSALKSAPVGTKLRFENVQ
jgi:hypothetical protein